MTLYQIPMVLGVFEDPELAFSTKGNAWVRIKTVMKDRVKDKNDQWVDGPPRWVHVKAFGAMVEHIADSVQRGDTIIVIGKLDIEEYETRDGEKRRQDVVLANEVAVSLRWGSWRKEGREESVPARAATKQPAEDTSDIPF